VLRREWQPHLQLRKQGVSFSSRFLPLKMIMH
jgi:hypothetical protein